MWEVLAYGALVFPGLFFAFRRILPSIFRTWTDADVVLVSERLVSSIHAVMATTAGVVVASSCRGDVMNDRHWLATTFVVRYGVPYMTYDLFAMYLSHYHRFRVKGQEGFQQHSARTVRSFLQKDFLLVLHHIALLAVLLPITLFFRKDQGDFFIGCLFLTEISTPFVSLGKILIQLGLQDCWLHKANGALVLLTFFTCRIALFPYMYWVYGRHHGVPLGSVPAALPLFANLGSLCILAPQLYWFTLLCMKGYRLYRRSRAQDSHAHPHAHASKED